MASHGTYGVRRIDARSYFGHGHAFTYSIIILPKTIGMQGFNIKRRNFRILSPTATDLVDRKFARDKPRWSCRRRKR